jgi:hypothetical protein
VIQTSIKSGWLLALCGVLYATGSFLILSMGDLDGSIVLRSFWQRALARLRLAFGVGTKAIPGFWY